MAEWKFSPPRIILDLTKSMGYDFSVGLNYMVFHQMKNHAIEAHFGKIAFHFSGLILPLEAK